MSGFNFTPFPLLTSEKLVLRQLRVGDAEQLFKLRADDRVNQYIDRPKMQAQKEAENFILKMNKSVAENSCIYWAITVPGKDELVGTMCLWNFSEDGSSGEVGYELMPDFWGNGIVSAGLALVIDYARELLGLSILKACIKPENEPSLRLVKQFGFEKRRQAKCGDVYEMALTQ